MVNKVHVALLDHSSISLDDLQNYARRVLPKGFKRSFGKSQARQKSFWAGRAILANLLSRVDGSYYVRADPYYGYLRLFDAATDQPADLYCNISHTDDIAVAAVATSPVGVDVEAKSRSGLRVMKRVATEEEMKQLFRFFLNHEVAAPIALWSAKEAFSKALGLGMKFGFTGFEMDLSVPPPWPGRTTIIGPLKVKDPRIGILSAEKYFITVCSSGEGFAAELESFPSPRWSGKG